MKNEIRDLLIQLGLCRDDSLEPFYPRVRDREDISVLRCRESGVLLLSRTDHVATGTYRDRADLSYWSAPDREHALASARMDDDRRARDLAAMIAQQKWMDVGTGLGGVLDRLRTLAASILAVEPQAGARRLLQDQGYRVFADVTEVRDRDVGVVTLFHVLEHVPRPVELLGAIRDRMAFGGRLVVEVPHAGDLLISLLRCEPFLAHTFWSEHLILHTRESLRRCLEHAGFSDIAVTGYQRYSVANHLYWLARGEPGGHKKWNFLDSEPLHAAYAQQLESANLTDTIIATAVKK